MLYFCTLFDSHYLSRGIVMYESLKRNCPEFKLYIFAFDELSLQILKELNLEHVTVISLAEFESPELLAVKPSRTKGEYCWTCTPFTIQYCIQKFNLSHCIYIDADLYFFENPQALIDEIPEKDSVLITEHRYTPKYDQSATSGIYCVQFMFFKNNDAGLQVLNWWADRCLEWCYGRYEDGKFGDQKYLDDWTTRFKTVHVLNHLGGGVAPWNIQQYSIVKSGERFQLTTRHEKQTYAIIFFHFHWVKFLAIDKVDLGYYDLNADALLLYRLYFERLHKTNYFLEKEFSFKPNQNASKPGWKDVLINLKRRLRGEYNIYTLKHGQIN